MRTPHLSGSTRVRTRERRPAAVRCRRLPTVFGRFRGGLFRSWGSARPRARLWRRPGSPGLRLGDPSPVGSRRAPRRDPAQGVPVAVAARPETPEHACGQHELLPAAPRGGPDLCSSYRSSTCPRRRCPESVLRAAERELPKRLESPSAAVSPRDATPACAALHSTDQPEGRSITHRGPQGRGRQEPENAARQRDAGAPQGLAAA